MDKNSKKAWNDFVVDNHGSFLQSWQWGEFQEKMGNKIWRLEGNGFKALVMKYALPFGKSYIYCPHGPVLQGPTGLDKFWEEIRTICLKEKAIFFKLEPIHEISNDHLQSSEKRWQPQKSLILDLHQSEDELLAQMHPKTRYNIRLARKKGVKIREDKRKLDIFLNLLKKTADRDKFFTHEPKYYRNLFNVLNADDTLKLFLAEHDGEIVAANLYIFWGKSAVYLHGASDYEKRRIMAPYLLQWHAITEAKRLNFQSYDFWGIDEEKWPGVTRFKKGFGGQEVSYPNAYDLVFNQFWYKLYKIVRKVRLKIKGV